MKSKGARGGPFSVSQMAPLSLAAAAAVPAEVRAVPAAVLRAPRGALRAGAPAAEAAGAAT